MLVRCKLLLVRTATVVQLVSLLQIVLVCVIFLVLMHNAQVQLLMLALRRSPLVEAARFLKVTYLLPASHLRESSLHVT
jgi:uncharacterized protein YhhL (DUF1145 family)